ncbi:MAG: hypothetical protein AB7U73_24740, partial [Pirellulales bacterium]
MRTLRGAVRRRTGGAGRGGIGRSIAVGTVAWLAGGAVALSMLAAAPVLAKEGAKRSAAAGKSAAAVKTGAVKTAAGV